MPRLVSNLLAGWKPAATRAVLLLSLVGCGSPPADGPEIEESLSSRELLVRLSVDLRGVHPSEEELAAFDADPSTYEAKVDEYLRDDRFLGRVKDIYAAVLRTRTGESYFDPAMAGLPYSAEQVAEAIGEEPLELVADVVAKDQPFTEILLADHTMANQIVSEMWRTTPVTGDAFQPATYEDGRPMAGVLSSTTLWLRYPSAGSNANRHRANELSRMFLCDDYLSRPVSFSRAEVAQLTSAGDVEQVIRDNGSCQGCHSSLDPLAGHFFGFWWEKDEEDFYASTTYVVEDEPLWSQYAGRSPAYFGTPTGDLRHLAEELATDDRFVECTVRTVWEAVQQRDVADADWTMLQAHKATFEDSELNLRELVRSIVRSDEYRAASFAKKDDAERISTVKTVSPEQLATIVEAKTGYRWTMEDRALLRDAESGVPVLAGGFDGRYVTSRTYEPTVSMTFVQERLAHAAGYHVAVHDLAPNQTEARILLTEVEVTDTPDVALGKFEAQIRKLYAELTGVPLADEAPEVEEAITLWKQVFSVTSSPTTSWAAVVAAVLRDPRILFY